MFIYIKGLASKIGTYMIIKFKDLLNQYDNYSFNKTKINNIQNYAYLVQIIKFNIRKYKINMVKSFNFINHINENTI